MLRSLLLLCLLGCCVSTYAQFSSNCGNSRPQLLRVMVDACASPTSEDDSEYIQFMTGTNSFDIDDLEFKVDCPEGVNTVLLNSWGSNPAYLAELNNAAGCSVPIFIDAYSSPFNGVVPPNANVIVYLNSPDIAFFPTVDYSSLCDKEPIYVAFDNSGGHLPVLKNNDACSACGCFRFLDILFGTCLTEIDYDITTLPGSEGSYIKPSGSNVGYGVVNDCKPLIFSCIPPTFDPIEDVEVCYVYELDRIRGDDLTGNEFYFTGRNGTGTQYDRRQEIYSDTKLYVYDPSSNCSDQDSFQITFLEVPEIYPVQDTTTCNEYVLPNIRGENLSPGTASYYLLPGGQGKARDPGDDRTTNTILFIYYEHEDCIAEEIYEVTIEDGPDLDRVGDEVVCGSTYELPIIEGDNLNDPAYYLEPGGTGQRYSELDTISTDGTIYVYDYDAGCFDERSFLLTLEDDIQAPIVTCSEMGESLIFNWTIDENVDTTVIQTIDGDQFPGNSTEWEWVGLASGESISIMVISNSQENCFSYSDTATCVYNGIICNTESGSILNLEDTIILCAKEIVDYPFFTLLDTLSVEHNGVFYNDSIDDLIFVIHDRPDTILGTTYGVGEPEGFVNLLLDSLKPDSIYYVSAVSGDFEPWQTVDYPIPCKDVSRGRPFIIRIIPEIEIASDTINRCLPGCFEIPINFIGSIPATLSYSWDGLVDSVLIDNAGFLVEICAMESGILEFISLDDGNSCPNTDLPSKVILVEEQTNIVTIALQGCEGDTIQYLNKIYYADHYEGFDTLPGMRSNGCDSILFVQAYFMDDVVYNLNLFICQGDTILINDQQYFEGQLSGSFVIENNNPAICDSIINVQISLFPPADTGLSIYTICLGDTLVLNGELFHELNTEGYSTLEDSSVNGCDSTYKIQIEFYPPADTGLSVYTICRGDTLFLNGELFHELNTEGYATLEDSSINGCDSTYRIQIEFYSPPDTGLQLYNICRGDTLNLNGSLYHELNSSGFETIEDGSIYGCDSVVKIEILFFDPPPVGQVFLQTCPGDSVHFNGKMYGPNHLSGLDTLHNGSILGCDSIVQVNLLFYQPPKIGSIEIKLCQNETIDINGKIFGENNVVGFDTIPNGSYLGCDSIHKIEIIFYDPPLEFLRPEICRNQTIIINGKEYNSANPSGFDSIPGGSIHGCDSIVVVNLRFVDTKSEDVKKEICMNEVISIEGIIFSKDHLSESIFLPAGSISGCDSLINVEITVREENVSSYQAIICPGDSLKIGNNWYHEQNLTGTEILQSTDHHGCDSIINVSLELEAFEVDFEFDASICEGKLNRTITFYSAMGISNGFHYSFDDFQWIQVMSLPHTISDIQDSVLNLFLQNEAGCRIEESIVFPISTEKTLDIGPDRIINLGDSVHIPLPKGFIDPVWSPDVCLDEFCYELNITPEKSTTISVTSFDISGCMYSDKLLITVRNPPDFYISNIFSPNFDELNDFVSLHLGKSILRLNQFQLFDRWGNLINSVKNSNENSIILWDGSYENVQAPAGVYVYVMELEYINGRKVIYTGDVTLIR